MEQGADRAGGPVGIFASGQRCGSTLVQRLFNSHPDIRVWGEHWGLLNSVLDLRDHFAEWGERDGLESRETFEREGEDAWTPNLVPTGDVASAAARAFVEAAFGDPARAAGHPRWGFKEVRYAAPTATRLRRLYPDLRLLHLTRSPVDVLRSLHAWAAEGQFDHAAIPGVLQAWCAINDSMLELEVEPWVALLRYEDLLADPAGSVAALAAFTDLDAAGFDLSVFARQIHGPGERGRRARTTTPWTELPRQLRALLADPDIVRVAAAYGYELPAVPAARMPGRVAARVPRWRSPAAGRAA
jgi:hypothetical protein